MRTRIGMAALAMALNSPALARADGFLRTQGQDIVDASGNKVMLRGVGLGNWLLPEGYMWKFSTNLADRPRRIEKVVSDLIGDEASATFWRSFRERYVAQQDIRRIAELGFNSVRPAINARLLMNDKGEMLEDGFALLDHLVAWCKESHIYVILDLHAAPGGQTGHNIDDSVDDQPHLFMDTQYQDQLTTLWTKIAERYKDEPTVAAYDLLNEPLPLRTGAREKYGALLEPVYKRVTKAIRSVDPRHMITVEGANWANDWTVFSTPKFDDNLVYQFHYYCRGEPKTMQTITQFLTRRDELNAPVWVGETGEKNPALYWATTDLFENHNIGWSFWPWKKMETSNTPYSIKAPAGWTDVLAYARNHQGPKPSRGQSQATFDELLNNIELANCTYFPDVVDAMFHRVPGKVEAENYGHGGANISYSVKNPSQLATQYRKDEPVQIELIDAAPESRTQGHAVVLQPAEWTHYEVVSADARQFAITLRAKGDGTPSALLLSINKAQPARKVTLDGTGWQTLKLPAAALAKGKNTLKLTATDGTCHVDWFSFD